LLPDIGFLFAEFLATYFCGFLFDFGEGFLDVIFEDKADLLKLSPVIHGVVFKGRHEG
jgi:hypothetical protein